MPSYTRQQLEDWLKTISVRGKSVLDIGGAQLPVKNRVKEWIVDNYKILDLPEPHECRVEPDYRFDLNLDINQWVNRPDEKFDIIFCLEVMEYIWNPVQALKNIVWFMKPKGILYISFHFVYPHHNPLGRDYLRYTYWGVIKLLEEAGLKVMKIKSRKVYHKNALLEFFLRERMRPSDLFKKHNDVGYLCKCKKVVI